jgi:hypothetical protein
MSIFRILTDAEGTNHPNSRDAAGHYHRTVVMEGHSFTRHAFRALFGVIPGTVEYS